MNTAATLEPAAPGALDHVLLGAFLENVPDIVYFKDRESRFIAASKSKARRHGCDSPAGLLGKSDADFFSEKHAAIARADERAIMATGEPIVGKLERLTWADGRAGWALSSKMPLRDEHGEIIGTFGITKDVTEAKEMELALEKANKELVTASRVAGMAEVATSVLHNVGNVLNSVNVSAALLATGLRDLRLDRLAQLSALLREHADDLGAYLTQDPAGRRIPEFLEALARHAGEERARLLGELESLQKNVEHIKEIVAMQQAYATTVGAVEPLDAAAVMEDALRMNSGALLRHAVRVVRDYRPVPAVLAEKGKVLQILVNLIRNAKYACDATGAAERVVTLRVGPGAAGRVRLAVEDNGVGIPRENLARIFTRGFTTRVDGHGFGLSSSVAAARDLKGTLTAGSEGPGTGAKFVLDLPASAAAPAGNDSASAGEGPRPASNPAEASARAASHAQRA